MTKQEYNKNYYRKNKDRICEKKRKQYYEKIKKQFKKEN